MVHIGGLDIQETEAKESLVDGLPGLHSELQANLIYIARPWLTAPKREKSNFQAFHIFWIKDTQPIVTDVCFCVVYF